MPLTTHFPSGKAYLVLRLETGNYLGTITKRIPFHIDNPLYGRPIEPLPATKKLRSQLGDGTVLELYRGGRLPQLGLAEYDGARDVYFGHHTGSRLSYGSDRRYELSISDVSSALMKFGLSMLPKDTKIKRALVALHVQKLYGKYRPAGEVIALKKRWHEIDLDARWGSCHAAGAYPVASTDAKWTRPMFGGDDDRHGDPIGSFKFEKTGVMTIDLTDAVRKWVSRQWPNHGFALVVDEKYVLGGGYPWRGVTMAASDYPLDPRQRPRLILALEGAVNGVAHRIKLLNDDIRKARARAKAAGKQLLVHVLSGKSITSRNLETQVLANPAVKSFIDARFVEARIDGDDPKHRPFLKRYSVERFPTALILTGEEKLTRSTVAVKAGEETFELIEPFAWNAMFGLNHSVFEFEQTYTKALADALGRFKTAHHFSHRIAASGDVLRTWSRKVGCSKGPSGGFLRR